MGALILGGVTDSLFQIFAFANVDGAGLSCTIPLQVGAATLFGAFITFMIDRHAKIQFFVPGVFVNVAAVVMNAVTYYYLRKDTKPDAQPLLQSAEAGNTQVVSSQPLLQSAEAGNTQVVSSQPTSECSVETNLIDSSSEKSPERFSTLKLVLIAITGALVGIPFGPCVALGGQEPYAFNPYVFS